MRPIPRDEASAIAGEETRSKAVSPSVSQRRYGRRHRRVEKVWWAIQNRSVRKCEVSTEHVTRIEALVTITRAIVSTVARIVVPAQIVRHARLR